MKTLKILAAAAIISAAVACNNTKTLTVAGVEAPSKSEIDTVSYLMGINWGSMIKGYNLGDLNFNEIKKGMNDFINAKGNQHDTDFVKQFKINPELMNGIMQTYIDKRTAYQAAVNKISQEKFFEEIRQKGEVETSDSGLSYIIKEAGNDNKPGGQDTVYVHYKLSLTDGTKLEEISEDQEPVPMILDRVIPGWTEGLQLIGEGGKITLYVPSDLGYGERGANRIEPNTPLVFDIHTVSVKHYIPKEEE